jgi:very-short-patch-repair endonuclease
MNIDDVAPLLDPSAVPRILSRADAHRFGYTDDAIKHRLATGVWQLVLPRTLLTSDTLLWEDRQRAAVCFAGRQALLSGAGALCDLGIRAVSRPARVLVLVPPDRAPRSTGWVRIRPSARPVRRALLPGPPRVELARAVADLALELRRLDDVRAVVAEVVRTDRCTIAELTAELRHGPQRGSAHLRQAIDEVAAGAWSAPEARAATLMRRHQLPRFEQNARIDLPGGRWVIVDFLWRALRAVLEIDSDTHHALTGDARRTADRHLALETLGFSVVHHTPAYVSQQPWAFVDGVHTWLRARAAELGLPWAS